MRMKTVSSYIHLRDVRLHAYHGVMEQERTVGNDYAIDLRVGYPIERAEETDDVADTLNYAELYGVVKREMAVASKLLEHVAGRIAKAIEREFPAATSIDLSITKINPPFGADCHGAGIELHTNKMNE